MPLVAGIPTWPPHLHVTSLSFTYSSLNLLRIFSMLSMTRATLQHLKLYFDAETHLNLQDIAGPPIEFSELRSLALGFQDPLSQLPFLWRAQLPTLDSLLIEDIRSRVQQREPTHNTLLHQLLHSVDPMDALFAVLLQVLRELTLTSLRLVGLAPR
ncbi:hypothetical protein B0H16DRAFT_1526054 [Mycena metata]|uniref:Uncharacterized protein n=1 Tax=Mycena metata TaxID=1033252 RepID=A0AAD7NKT1_9AGAR|nr:hypothetical protein B0H16DRAFT_1526054 [Mycena metata]